MALLLRIKPVVMVYTVAKLWLCFALIVSSIHAEKANKSTNEQEDEIDGSIKDDPTNSKKKLPEFPNGVIKFNNPDLLKGISGAGRAAAGSKRQGYSVVQAEFRSGVTTSLMDESRTLAKKYSQIMEEELGYTAMQVSSIFSSCTLLLHCTSLSVVVPLLFGDQRVHHIRSSRLL